MAARAWQNIARGVAGRRDRFLHDGRGLRGRQRDFLRALLDRHRDTDFGRAHGFSRIRDEEAYRRALPLQDADEHQAWMGRMDAGHHPVLCADAAFVERTGGSSGGARVIACGPSGMGDFQAALHPWLDDLLARRPAIMEGPAYWSISPVMRAGAEYWHGLPLGPGNDAAWFGEELAGHLQETLAVPPHVAAIPDLPGWRFHTLLHLLRAAELRLISVWSPGFLLRLMEALEEQAEALCRALPRERAAELERALMKDRDARVLWSRLDTISCWTHGRAAAWLEELRERFLGVHVQPKGLLATEGVVSLPLEEAGDPVLAADSGFFEFIDGEGDMHLAWELETGAEYEVVLSNNLGLYRYRLGDRVRVTGRHQGLPMLVFLGRGNRQVDLCGEKLDEAFVASVLAPVRGFALLLPVMEDRPHYVCISERPLPDLEESLAANPQYAYARRLGQLAPLEYRVLPGVERDYQQWRLSLGQALGDIKPLALLPDDAFLRWLEARP